jgi:hypothetical protein
MSKQSMREEADRLIREAMARKTIVVKQGNTRIEAVCGKCGAPNRLRAQAGDAVRHASSGPHANLLAPATQSTTRAVAAIIVGATCSCSSSPASSRPKKGCSNCS